MLLSGNILFVYNFLISQIEYYHCCYLKYFYPINAFLDLPMCSLFSIFFLAPQVFPQGSFSFFMKYKCVINTTFNGRQFFLYLKCLIITLSSLKDSFGSYIIPTSHLFSLRL